MHIALIGAGNRHALAVDETLGQFPRPEQQKGHRAPNLAVKPSVVAGEGMRLGECAIKTDLGSVDLGIRGQLGEIERGFFDRVGRSVAAISAQDSSSREAAE